eukprot:TRINITY_DN80145_c0_g1_i1.p1 TRINITY_DN80145_c0_g1~~TRINITY_DN80145_c0_g1_i1.p1  ORF type:complete len:182 (+),score=12.59 TRINITY_DN80145_c0_g1_i1:64-609(+)
MVDGFYSDPRKAMEASTQHCGWSAPKRNRGTTSLTKSVLADSAAMKTGLSSRLTDDEKAEPEHHRQRPGCARPCLTADVRHRQDMKLTEIDLEDLQRLEKEADELLAQISASSEPVSPTNMQRLESCASAAAKIAYGSGRPELLSVQMSTLIAWTDHLDDASWVERFLRALSERPLVSPWK